MLGASGFRLEVLFGVNLVIDFLLFWFAGTISWSKPRWWRVALAAVLGSVLTLVPLLVDWGAWLFTAPALVLASIVLLLFVAWPCSPRQFGVVMGGFWAAAGATGGVVMLLVERMGLAGVSLLPMMLVTGGASVGLLGLLLIWQAHRERRVVKEALYQVQIQVGGHSVVLTGLLDSGNSLRTPVSRVPVVVVEAEPLRPYLPPAVVEALSMGWDALSAIPPTWQSRCQLVPYAAVGNPDGSLLTFVPDSVAIWEGRERRWIEVSGMIGLTLQPLDPHGHYQVLLSPPMLMEAQGE